MSCGDFSVSKCKKEALRQAQHDAVERGSAVLLHAATVVKNFQVTADPGAANMAALCA
jgi:hypothetical protein